MDSILQQITDWLKEMLISAIMGNLSGMFESVNNQVGEIATSVGRTPESFSPEIFAMVRNISESVIIPIAGLILTFIACYELIQLIIDHNNLANFETWIFFKWVFKTFVAVMLITNTFNITMAVFDVAQHVVNASGGIIAGNTAIDASGLEALEETLQGMDLGPLIGLLLQSFVVQITMSALAIIIFVIVYEYHTQIGNNVFHICQFAELLERNGSYCQAEPEIMGDEAAWQVGRDQYLAIQTCEDGYDYTLFDKEFHEIDGGQLDNPELSIL